MINLSDGGAMMLARVQGHLWESFNAADGLTRSLPVPQQLVHPAVPPMLFHLSDGKPRSANCRRSADATPSIASINAPVPFSSLQ